MIQPMGFAGRLATSRAPTTTNMPNPPKITRPSTRFSLCEPIRRSSKMSPAMPAA
jgi:hypothetical protein